MSWHGKSSSSGASTAGAALPLRRRWGALGDSITAQSTIITSETLRGWTGNSYLAWMRRYLGNHIDLPQERVYAVSAATIGQPAADGQPATNTVIDGQLAKALADKLDVAVIHMGTNSITGDADLPTMIAQSRQVYEALIANGTFIVAVAVRCRGAAAAWNTTGRNRKWAALNRWLADYCNANSRSMLFIDPNPALLDLSTGNAKAGMYVDALHDNALSAWTMGKLIADTVKPFLLAADSKSILASDVYDATFNPGGNLIANPFFAGTGGNAAINGSTGVAADGWDVGRNNGGSSITVAGSRVADPSITGLMNQVVTLGGTCDNATSFLSYYFNDISNFAVGDTIYYEIECDWTMSTANMGAVVALLGFQNASYQDLASGYDGLWQPAHGPLPAPGAGTFLMRTSPIKVPPTTRYIFCQIIFNPSGSGAIAGNFKFRRPALRKVVA